MIAPSLLLALALFLLWVALFVRSASTRREQLGISILGLLLSPGILLFSLLSDVERSSQLVPSMVGLEDFLTTFSLCGIAAVAYQVFFNRRRQALPKRDKRRALTKTPWPLHIVLLLSLWILLCAVLLILFKATPLSAALVSGLLIGMYMLMHRHDLLVDALLSGLFLAVLIFVLEYFFFVRLFPEYAGAFWQWNPRGSFLIRGVPLEELLWAATIGFTLGPLYEFVKGYRLK